MPGDFGEDNGGGLYKYTKSGAANAPSAPFRCLLREIVVWFNSLCALLTIAYRMLLIVGSRKPIIAWAGATALGALAIVVFAQQAFDYVRDDGVIEKVSTGSNAAFSCRVRI